MTDREEDFGIRPRAVEQLSKEIPQPEFGKNLKTIREGLGLSQVNLARRSGLTPACISQIENGTREPTLGTIIRILDVIPVTFEKLTGREHSEEKCIDAKT